VANQARPLGAVLQVLQDVAGADEDRDARVGDSVVALGREIRVAPGKVLVSRLDIVQLGQALAIGPHDFCQLLLLP
jgi:hypothetical protein